MAIAPAATPPDHVPPELVVDFDCFDIPDCDDPQLAWRRLQESGPEIFWTPRNGGHWVLTRAEDIEQAQTDHERFSHSNYHVPKTPRRFRPLPLGVDPPEHRRYRALIAPAFSPAAVRNLSDTARAVTRELLDDIAPRGECEFVGDFAKVFPMVVFLGIVDLPSGDRTQLVPHAEALIRGRSVEQRRAGLDGLAAYLEGWIEERTAHPGEDLISRIASSQVDGRPIEREEVFGLTMLVMAGGLDTVAAMLSFTTRFLARHPAHRQELVQRPELIPAAVDELIRRHGLIATAREVAQDFEHKGIQFRTGDMVQVPNVLYALDEHVAERPLEVDFHREKPAPHATFGNGPHRCPGANLARQELRVFLEEWLARIPEFTVRPGSTTVVETGLVSGIRSLELVWELG
jgi:cytochrome P450